MGPVRRLIHHGWCAGCMASLFPGALPMAQKQHTPTGPCCSAVLRSSPWGGLQTLKDTGKLCKVSTSSEVSHIWAQNKQRQGSAGLCSAAPVSHGQGKWTISSILNGIYQRAFLTTGMLALQGLSVPCHIKGPSTQFRLWKCTQQKGMWWLCWWDTYIQWFCFGQGCIQNIGWVLGRFHSYYE